MSVAVNMICSDREGRRLEVDIEATLRSGGVHQVDVEIEDISVSGFRMSTSVDLKDGELITIGLAGLGMQPAVIVRRIFGQYGCQFINKVPQSYVDRLKFEKPNTIMPFTSATLTDNFSTKSAPADARLPFLIRIAIILGLGTVAWILFLKVITVFLRIL